MKRTPDEMDRMRGAALENVKSILAARRRAEEELLQAKEDLEHNTAELAHSLSMIRATLDATTDGILVTDDSGRVRDVNRHFASMWRVPADVLDSRDAAALLSWICSQVENQADYETRLADIQGSDDVETFDELRLRDGRTFERVSKLLIVEGARAGRVWSFRDVTERHRAEEEHAHFAAIVASSNDAIIGVDLQGVITSWNSAAERIFGYTAAEAVGQHLAIILPPDRLEEEERILSQLAEGKRIEHFETVRVRKDRRSIRVSLTVSPIRDASGNVIGASKISRDVTERDHLLAREQAARARAEEAGRLKDEFLATVSHELRTPLNAILGWAHVLRRAERTERTDPRERHAVEVIERNARAQARVIDDLLDVSRIITGKLRLDVHPLMPATAIESALDSLRPMADAKGIRLHSVLDSHAGPVSGDPARLQQVVWNLVSNGIKFTPKGGRVEVRLERVDSSVEIAVSDTGEGIGPEFLPHVFDRFRQSDASIARRTGGLGLGLAIVRHLVELHGGTVGAESPGPGQGATFMVRLPLRPVRSHAAVSAADSPEDRAMIRMPDLTGFRVLVVDDEADTRDLLREVLEQCGAEVRDASSSEEALEAVKAWTPGVIVSDIGMPGVDGYEFIRCVRAWEREHGLRIPAVALTAYARSEDRIRALLAGYQVHVAKPIEPVEFALIVAGAIQPGDARP
ncbi:MAG TPA: PAS domain S-box protein [Candidatus Eisenbacteria bacterium]|nr:PAS domain S-box protein [Candidatus Eisenbacteria bacterium]